MARSCIGQGFRLLLLLVLILAPAVHAVAALAEVSRTANHEAELHSTDHQSIGSIGDCDGCCDATSNAGCALMCANGGASLAAAISAAAHEAKRTLTLDDIVGAGLSAGPDLRPPRS